MCGVEILETAPTIHKHCVCVVGIQLLSGEL